MNTTLLRVPFLCWFAILCLAGPVAARAADAPALAVVSHSLTSTVLRDTRTDLDPVRQIKVILPPSYASSGKSCPVVYLCHSIFQSPEQMLADGKILRLLQRGFAAGKTAEFIVVIGDYSSPSTGSLYENSPATGRWLDHTVEELVPFIDRTYRTLRGAESRALVGEMMGGGGALLIAMRHPDVFSVAYALNPVRTGTGLLPVQWYPNWEKIHAAKSFADLGGEHISQIFVTMSQAFLPNPNRPPFYCDFLMDKRDGQLVYHPENARKLVAGFAIVEIADHYADNLRRLRAVALDWARYDPVQDHVYGSAALSRKLDLLGVEHEAEEYRGVYWHENWREHGRFDARVLPFLARHLVF